MARKTSQSVKDKFSEKLPDMKRSFVLHFDGKSVQEFTQGRKMTNERLAILVSSPDLQAPQLLGIPPVTSTKGHVMAVGIVKMARDWGILDKILGFCFDTTSPNTGIFRGACQQIEEELGNFLLWLACRRHCYELHIKHVALNVGRKTKGNEDLLFKRFRDKWNEILDMGIEMNKLQKFDWKANLGTVLEEVGHSTLLFCKKCLQLDVFPRADYKQLCKLTVVYLGGVVDDFKFQWPGPVHHARFMAKAIYYLKMRLLSGHETVVKLLSHEEGREVELLSEFVGVFHSQWFLRCAMSVSSPHQDLLAISHMRKYAGIRPESAENCLKSLARHPWYLTEHLVIMCMADDDLEDEVRKAVATALDNTDRPGPAEFTKGKPEFPEVTTDNFWEGIDPGHEMMGLAKLVGPSSWKIPELIGLKKEDMVWLKLEVYQWGGSWKDTKNLTILSEIWRL